jgi:hypothetical protein
VFALGACDRHVNAMQVIAGTGLACLSYGSRVFAVPNSVHVLWSCVKFGDASG